MKTRSPALALDAYYGDAYADAREQVAALLADVSDGLDWAVRDIAPLPAARSADTPGPTVVFTADPAASAVSPAGTLFVTPDDETAAAALDAGAADALVWTPGGSTALLAAKLRRFATDYEGPETDPPARALDRISDAIVELDGQDRITYCNSAGASLLDADRETLLGESAWDALDPGVAETLRERAADAREEASVVGFELETDDDRLFAVRLYPAGERLSVYAREITAERERETDRAMYEYLVTTVGDGVYILDDEGRFTFVNDALCEMTGYDRSELVGSSVHIIKEDGTVEEAEDALRDLLRQVGGDGAGDTRPIAKLDVNLVRKDGTRVPCTDRMTLRPLENGEFTGTVGTLRDVTDQKRREQILNNLLGATQDMVAAETTAAVAERVVQVATETIDTDGATVRVYDPTIDKLVPEVVSAETRRRLGDRPRYDPDEGPVGTAFTEGRTITTADLDHLDDSDPDVAAGTYLPVGDDRVLVVGHTDPDAPDEDERRFLELLAATAGSVFDRVERDQQRRRYEAIVETVDDMLFTVDDGRFTLVTDSFADLLGTTRDALVGTPLADVLVGPLPEGLDTAADGRVVTETAVAGADGETVPVRISLAPMAGDDGDGAVGTVRDIRELRMAEAEASRQRQRFAELFETLTDPVVELVETDDGAEIRAVNAPFAALTDCEQHALEGTTVAAAAGTLPDSVADALATVRDSGVAVETEVRVRGEAGVRSYLVRTIPYQAEGRDRAFVVLTDVTEVRQQGVHLRVLHRLLRHNLRNRTTVIQGRAELIRAETDRDRVAELAARIERASESLVDTSETARTVQRILEDDDHDRTRIDATTVATRLQRLAGQIAPETDVTVSVDTDRALPYDDALESAVTELLDNAVEYGTPGPGGAVAVTVGERSDGTVRIAVTDDGPGIPDDEWAVVAGDREITQLQHASGLGLWLAKWVADRYGGSLVRVPEGDGTTVAIDVPV